jgi:hypothetical protein
VHGRSCQKQCNPDTPLQPVTTHLEAKAGHGGYPPVVKGHLRACTESSTHCNMFGSTRNIIKLAQSRPCAGRHNRCAGVQQLHLHDATRWRAQHAAACRHKAPGMRMACNQESKATATAPPADLCPTHHTGYPRVCCCRTRPSCGTAHRWRQGEGAQPGLPAH